MPARLAFLSGSPGPGELLVIFLLILVLFGPRRLPDIVRSLTRTLNDLRRASQDFKDQILSMESDIAASSDESTWPGEPRNIPRELPLPGTDTCEAGTRKDDASTVPDEPGNMPRELSLPEIEKRVKAMEKRETPVDAPPSGDAPEASREGEGADG